MKGKTGRRLFVLLILLFLYAPIVILAVYSFTDATTIGAIRAFSLKNYVTLFTTEELLNMICLIHDAERSSDCILFFRNLQ